MSSFLVSRTTWQQNSFVICAHLECYGIEIDGLLCGHEGKCWIRNAPSDHKHKMPSNCSTERRVCNDPLIVMVSTVTSRPFNENKSPATSCAARLSWCSLYTCQQTENFVIFHSLLKSNYQRYQILFTPLICSNLCTSISNTHTSERSTLKTLLFSERKFRIKPQDASNSSHSIPCWEHIWTWLSEYQSLV
jgi:hypothetical protein